MHDWGPNAVGAEDVAGGDAWYASLVDSALAVCSQVNMFY